MNFDKVQVLQKLQQTGMVPVFYHKDAEVAKQVIKAPREMLIERADLEEETVDYILNILNSEFE